MEKFKFIKNLSKEAKSCDIWIEGELTDDYYGANAAFFRSELNYAISYMGVNNVNVRINSIGGSVKQGYSIYGAIQNAIDQGVKVDTYNEGFAFSMAAMIFLAGNKRISKPYAQFMTHKASYEGSDEEGVKALMDNINASFIGMIKDRCGKTDEEAAEFFGESDYFFSAEMAIEKNFATAIYKERAKMLDPEAVAKIAASFNPTEQKSKPPINMDIRKQLGLPEAATDAEVNAKLQELQNASKAAEAAQAQIQAAEKEAARIKAEAFVDKCVAEGKIKAENREKAIVNATANFDVFKDTMDTIEVQKTNGAAEFYAQGQRGAEGADGGRTNWKLSDWLQNDPVALGKLQETEPEKFKAISAKSGIKSTATSCEVDLRQTLSNIQTPR